MSESADLNLFFLHGGSVVQLRCIFYASCPSGFMQ